MKKTKTSDKKVIFDEIIYLYNSSYKFNNLANVVHPGSFDSNRFGIFIPRIALSNYTEIFSIVSEESLFMIELNDGSFICYSYEFSKDNALKEFSLSFLPNPDSKHLSFDSCDYNGEYYLRIDYKPEDYKKFIHPKLHLHTSFYNHIRFPVDSIITPLRFLFLILRFIYNSDEDTVLLEKKMKEENYFNERQILSREEIDKLFLHII